MGYLPKSRIQKQLSAVTLVAVPLATAAPSEQLHILWKGSNRGKGLRWFVDDLSGSVLR